MYIHSCSSETFKLFYRLDTKIFKFFLINIYNFLQLLFAFYSMTACEDCAVLSMGHFHPMVISEMENFRVGETAEAQGDSMSCINTSRAE